MKYITILLITLLFSSSSCNKYLDIVPDNLPTIEYSFALRSMAEKYLFTCYSYMPLDNEPNANPAFFAGGELWHHDVDQYIPIRLARGLQNTNDPLLNHWDGGTNAESLFDGIRDCNIFLDNIHKVKEMTEAEKARWRAEVTFLKAYYHFYLLRKYGPIPLIRKNIEINAPKEEMDVFREPIDVGINYIVELLDEAVPNLPQTIFNEHEELGRITQPIALSVKALVLVTAASPLYNGNSDYANFKDKRGIQLFNPTHDPSKWSRATAACKEAIDACHAAGIKLYDFNGEVGNITTPISAELRTQMSIRNSVAKRWNVETIWRTIPNTSRSRVLEVGSQARLDPGTHHASGGLTNGEISPTLDMVEMFYTQNGVPITEDKTWDYQGRYKLQVATAAEKSNIKEGYETVALNFNREPRFYASLGFDGGIWFGQGKTDESQGLWWVEAKYGQYSGKLPTNNFVRYSITGYFPKKLVNYENVYNPTANYTGSWYPWPVMRLADLYLLYAEALNESSGPAGEPLTYINLVRARAGLKTVEESWSQYSNNPGKYLSKEGLRDIIRQERGLELAFEGHRFWDIRRWKTAIQVLNNRPVRGWDIEQTDAVNYYREKVLFVQSFQFKDYFWPISNKSLITNQNLVQNPGW